MDKEVKKLISKYSRISRSMSEINEELEKIAEAGGDYVMNFMTFSAIVAFCDWLCGETEVPLSKGVELAKFAADAVGKGVPIEDVSEFVEQKLAQTIIDCHKKKDDLN